MIDHFMVISWDIHWLQDLLSTGVQAIFLLSTDPIMFGLIHIILVSPYKTITPQVIYFFRNILTFLFIIQTSSTWFRVNLILHPLHFVIQKFSNVKIYLPTSRKKIGFNLLDDEYFIPYINDTIPNSPAGCQIPTQAKLNMWIIYINGEDPITYQGVLDELNRYQSPRGKSKIKISLCISNI